MVATADFAAQGQSIVNASFCQHDYIVASVLASLVYHVLSVVFNLSRWEAAFEVHTLLQFRHLQSRYTEIACLEASAGCLHPLYDVAQNEGVLYRGNVRTRSSEFWESDVRPLAPFVARSVR